MTRTIALKTILWIAVAGLLFSGYLSYSELFGSVCPIGGCTSVKGVPACVYGFVMYFIVLVISILGIKSKEQ